MNRVVVLLSLPLPSVTVRELGIDLYVHAPLLNFLFHSIFVTFLSSVKDFSFLIFEKSARTPSP